MTVLYFDACVDNIVSDVREIKLARHDMVTKQPVKNLPVDLDFKMEHFIVVCIW